MAGRGAGPRDPVLLFSAARGDHLTLVSPPQMSPFLTHLSGNQHGVRPPGLLPDCVCAEEGSPGRPPSAVWAVVWGLPRLHSLSTLPALLSPLGHSGEIQDICACVVILECVPKMNETETPT